MAPIYITEGLLNGLLEAAIDAEPESFAVGLEVTSAGELTPDPVIDAETPVFTHFYHPAAGQSITAVFGMDFGTPVGATRGRFVSHPQGDRSVSMTDDLHAILIVAVPPWDRESTAAFDRRGRRRQLITLDAIPPDEPVF